MGRRIAALVFVLGLVADMYRPASMAAVADIVPDVDRTRAYALQFWAINLGFSIASASAGLLLHLGFGLLFVLDALTTFAFGMLALRFVPESRPQTGHEPARLADPLRLFRAETCVGDTQGPWAWPGAPRGYLGHCCGFAFAASPLLLWVGCLVAGVSAAAGQYWLLAKVDVRAEPQPVAIAAAVTS